jgi:hypothetical protein
MLGADESLIGRMTQKRKQVIEVSQAVDQTHRFGVQAQLQPRHHLEHLFERAETSRQNYERIGSFGHRALANVHRLHDDEFVESLVRNLWTHQMLGNDADDIAARGERRIGDVSHHPDVPATVDDPYTPARKQGTEFARRIGILRSRTAVRSTEDANGADWPCHAPSLFVLAPRIACE